MDEVALRTRILEIMQDENLTEAEKSEARQKLLMGTQQLKNLDDTSNKSKVIKRI